MKRLFVTVLVLGAFVLSSNLFAQDKGKSAQSYAQKLKQKVLLNESQAAKVESILASYLAIEKDSRSESKDKFTGQIESILDERQKAKYDIIKKDWWIELDKQ